MLPAVIPPRGPVTITIAFTFSVPVAFTITAVPGILFDRILARCPLPFVVLGMMC